MRNLITVLVIALVMVCFSSVYSNAGSKTIKPSQLIARDTDAVYTQTPSYVCALDWASSVNFYAEIKLPVGKTLKKITYYHQGETGSRTSLSLYRARMGDMMRKWLLYTQKMTLEKSNLLKKETLIIQRSKVVTLIGFLYPL